MTYWPFPVPEPLEACRRVLEAMEERYDGPGDSNSWMGEYSTLLRATIEAAETKERKAREANDSDAAANWRVRWRYRGRPNVGDKGDAILTKEKARAACVRLNREYPELYHWPEQEGATP